MVRIGIFFGSSTGNTEAVAAKIHEALGGNADAPKSIADATADELAGYDYLILGTSTWGAGDLQDDWDDALSMLESTELSGKKVAVFGLGDQEGYPDTFVDGIGIIADVAAAQGADIVGSVPTDGYDFDDSKAVKDGKFIGLPLDDDTQESLTDQRIAGWVSQINEAFA